MAGSAPTDPTKEGTGEAGFMPSWKSHLHAEGWALLCQSCMSHRGHRHGTTDTLKGLRWLLWATHTGEELSAPANPRPQPPPSPIIVQTTSSGYLPQITRTNACANHSTWGPSWGNKLHRAAADEQAVKHQKNLLSPTDAI